MAEWKALISDWLSEYANLQEDDIKSFAAEHEHNHEIASALFSLFSPEEESDTSPSDENDQLLENVCLQLFYFYRSQELLLQRFTLQLIPTIIYTYLSYTAKGTIKKHPSIETLLIAIYNFEVVDENGTPKVVAFRLPSLAQASIYHEPMSLGSQFLTESALRRWEECNTKLISWGPYSQVEVINPQNRLKVMTALLFIYNQQLCLLPKLSLRHFCIASSRIVKQGFGAKNKVPRIPVSSPFLLELAHGAYFAMFNEMYTIALQAVKDIDKRGHYELLPDVMLVTSAIINSLKTNASGQPSDGPMGLSLALSPATTTVTMSKSMITNASFRTKKLPDDIPIQAGQVVPTESSDMLSSITEEGETDSTPIQRGSTARLSKPKLSAFPVLGKKNKDAKVNSNEKKVTLKESKLNRNSAGSNDMVDSISPVPQKKNAIEMVEVNGGMKEERMSLTSDSLQNSMDTSDSLDSEVAPRLTAMQVSSV